jgi:hypothetical protein
VPEWSELKIENSRLRCLVADLSLEKVPLEESLQERLHRTVEWQSSAEPGVAARGSRTGTGSHTSPAVSRFTLDNNL